MGMGIVHRSELWQKKTREFFKLLFLLTPIVQLIACTTVPVDRNNFSAGGVWEQDENTDPRFVHTDIAASHKIGDLYTSGEAVYVNNINIKDNTDLKNNDFISTGSGSGVLVVFEKVDNCTIRIQDLNRGNGYVNTGECQYHLETKHAVSTTQESIYHINVSPQQTEITVIEGLLNVALKNNPSNYVMVNQGYEVIVRPDVLFEPKPLSLEEINRRTKWRDQYEFYEQKVDWWKVGLSAAAIAIAAVTAVIVSDDDDSGGRPRPPTTDTNTTFPTVD